jgi:CheY-like chemotaxis protein
MSDRPSTAEGPAGTSAYLVLVVQDEPFERALTAGHLRKAGFDVIEVADGNETQRVLDAIYVDIVFADLEIPGQTNGLGLLRLLYERHPGTKTILTSGAETDMAAAEGYGIFLRKPFRLVDLDYSIQRVAANVAVRKTNGAMWADGRQTASSEAQPGRRSGGPNERHAPQNADGLHDEIAKQGMAELSRQLAERAARQRVVDPDVTKAARRAALQAYDRVRSRRLRLALGFALGAVVGSGIANFAPMLALWPVPLESVATAPTPVAPELRPSSTAQSSPLPSPAASDLMRAADPMMNETANSQPVLAPPEPASPLPPSGPASIGFDKAARTDTTSGDHPALVGSTPNQMPLKRTEVQEVQARLRLLGFNPGPIDGAAGAKTAGAVMNYQHARGQSQTGTVDRELLEQLRHDPAPQLAQRFGRPTARTRHPHTPRRSDPF